MVNLNFFSNNPSTAFESSAVSSAGKEYSLDQKSRVEMLKSPLLTLLHPLDRLRQDAAILDEVKKVFRERHHFQDSNAFDRVWRRLGAKVWTPAQELTLGAMQAIEEEFKTRLIYHGAGISPAGEATTPMGKFVQMLLHGTPFPKDFINQHTLHSIFVKRDPELMQQFRQELQRTLTALADQVPQKPGEIALWRTFLGNVLSLIPFTYPADGVSLQIPVLKDGVCKLINYELQSIPMRFSKLSTPLPALAMNPKEENARPILSFIGTTYPSGDGYAASVQSDFTPRYSVGEFVFEKNKEKIAEWMAGKSNVHVVGMSLGGALALHALRHHKEQIGRLDAYCPPGLYRECWNEDLGSNCDVNIHRQPKDLVSKMGFWPTASKVYEVIEHQGIAENALTSHVFAFSGATKVTIIKHDPEKQNQSLIRRILTVLHRYLGPAIFYFPIECTLNVRYCIKRICKIARKLFC